MNEKKTIVFVCTGNTCRSPMAEAIFSSELRRRRRTDIEGYSAGIFAREEGENINEKSAAVLAENGYTIENVHARKLDKDILLTAFAFVCMTDEQRDYLMELRWNALRKSGAEAIENNVYSFSEIAGYQIPDPYGKEIEAYREVFRMLSRAMPHLTAKFFPEEKEKENEKEEIKKPTRRKKTTAVSTVSTAATAPKKRGRPKKSTLASEKKASSTSSKTKKKGTNAKKKRSNA